MSSPSPDPTGGEERHEAGEDTAPSRGGCASSPRRAGTVPSCGAGDVGAGGGGGGGDAPLPNDGGGGDAPLPSGGGFVRVEAAVEQRVSLVELRAFLREAQRLLGLASFDELDLLTHELVKNALALGEPEVRVAVARRDGGVRVEVRDYGYGLPCSTAPRPRSRRSA